MPIPKRSSPLILDTHVWIWLINGDERIREAGFLEIVDRARQDSSIKIPAICLWEVAMLAAKRRITLAESTREWLIHASSAPGVSIFPLTPEIAHESSTLPGLFHGDPADRMIVATARSVNGTLLTFDKLILQYARAGYVNCVMPQQLP